MIGISRPAHKKYALHSVSNETYEKFVNGYSISKKFGVRGVWGYVAGSGLWTLCYEALIGETKRCGKRKLASGIIGGATYLCTPLIPLITNSTKIIRIANATHLFFSTIAEVCEDCTSLAWLPLDYALCGQPIPMGAAGRFNLMGGDPSLFDFDEL